MAEFNVDPYVDLYARRTSGMSASEVRALFAVASRPEVVSLAGGMPDVRALSTDDVIEVVETVLAEHADAALQYGAGQGTPALRACLAALMNEEATEADADDFVVTTGAQQALDLIAKVLIDPGDEIVVEAPSYVGALSAFSAYEPRYMQIELDDDGMIVEDLEDALVKGARPKFVYTVPNFHNPAGVTMSRSRREQLVALCREARIPIVEDNPYGLLRFEGDREPTLRSLDPHNVIYVGTVSKVFSPAVRVGWAVAETGLLQRLVLAKEAADLCGSSFTMLVTERYLSGERWRGNLERLVSMYRSRRDAMLAALVEHFPADAAGTRCAWRSATRPRTTSRRGCGGSDCSSPTSRSCTGPCRDDRADRGAGRRSLAGTRGVAPLGTPGDDRAAVQGLRRLRPGPRRGAFRRNTLRCKGFCMLRGIAWQGWRGWNGSAPARAPGGPVHGHAALPLSGRVRQGPGQGDHASRRRLHAALGDRPGRGAPGPRGGPHPASGGRAGRAPGGGEAVQGGVRHGPVVRGSRV